MNVEQVKLCHTIALETLWKLLDDEEWRKSQMGICRPLVRALIAERGYIHINQINRYVSEGLAYTTYISKAMSTWPLFSGNNGYPIPDPCDGLPAQQVYSRVVNSHDSSRFWTGGYGELRIQLVMFLIQYITADLEALERSDDTV